MIIEAGQQALDLISTSPAQVLFIVPEQKHIHFVSAPVNAFRDYNSTTYHRRGNWFMSTQTTGCIRVHRAEKLTDLRTLSGSAFDAIFAFDIDSQWSDQFIHYLTSLGRISSRGMKDVEIPIQHRVAIV